MRMLAKAGVKLRIELGDNELRYILWRSYENLAESGRYRSIISEAEDIYQQWMAMMKKYVKPLNDVLHEITHGLKATFRGGKITLEVIETYLNCKHGLERNDKFAMRV